MPTVHRIDGPSGADRSTPARQLASQTATTAMFDGAKALFELPSKQALAASPTESTEATHG